MEPEGIRVKAPEYLYHVTLARRLGGIAERGIRPGSPRTIGGPAYDGHSKGRVFLTVGDGVRFWHERAADHAFDQYDDVVGSGAVPVVLRLSRRSAGRRTKDPAGTDDAGHPAFITRTTIAAADLEFFDGQSWRPVSAADELKAGIGARDGYLLRGSDSPLCPPVDSLSVVVGKVAGFLGLK